MSRWASIQGEEGRYAVSDAGEVMAMNFAQSGLPGILRPNVSGGYLSVQLSGRKRKTVHSLVAAAFIGPRPDGLHVNHIDGDKANNAAKNLEYVTPSENMKHAHRVGLQSNAGERHSQSRLTDSTVMSIFSRVHSGEAQGLLAKEFGVSQSQVSLIKHGKCWAHVTRKVG